MEYYTSVIIKQIIARHNNMDESKHIMLGDGNNTQKNSYCTNPSIQSSKTDKPNTW